MIESRAAPGGVAGAVAAGQGTGGGAAVRNADPGPGTPSGHQSLRERFQHPRHPALRAAGIPGGRVVVNGSLLTRRPGRCPGT